MDPRTGVPSTMSTAAGRAGVDPMTSNAGDAVSWRASLKLCLGAVEGITEGLDEGGAARAARERGQAIGL